MSILSIIYIIGYSATIIIFCLGITKFFTPILFTIGKKIFNLNPEYFIKTFFLLAMVLALKGVFFRTEWIVITYIFNLFSFIMLIIYVYKFSSIKHTVEKFKKSKEKKTITKNKVNSNNEELIKYLKGLFSRGKKEDNINILLSNLINGNFENYQKGTLIFDSTIKINASRVLFQLKENGNFDDNMLQGIYLNKYIKMFDGESDIYLNSEDFTKHASKFSTTGKTATALKTDKITLPFLK
ncbi:hypothetical protein [Polaribacter sp. L3A8]|uniref:hypothetical protein n=1 Tax=Polaribacter sp. L3A8 TaxID=2686361 RepID=UPI00131B4D74|nr:hypothetical protein [Polaribacter sp. L3A8]